MYNGNVMHHQQHLHNKLRSKNPAFWKGAYVRSMHVQVRAVDAAIERQKKADADVEKAKMMAAKSS